MDKEIKFSAPNIPEKEAIEILARFLSWRKNKTRMSKITKNLFNRYSFSIREYENSLIVKIYRKDDKNDKN